MALAIAGAARILRIQIRPRSLRGWPSASPAPELALGRSQGDDLPAFTGELERSFVDVAGARPAVLDELIAALFQTFGVPPIAGRHLPAVPSIRAKYARQRRSFKRRAADAAVGSLPAAVADRGCRRR